MGRKDWAGLGWAAKELRYFIKTKKVRENPFAFNCVTKLVDLIRVHTRIYQNNLMRHASKVHFEIEYFRSSTFISFIISIFMSVAVTSIKSSLVSSTNSLFQT